MNRQSKIGWGSPYRKTFWEQTAGKTVVTEGYIG